MDWKCELGEMMGSVYVLFIKGGEEFFFYFVCCIIIIEW